MSVVAATDPQRRVQPASRGFQVQVARTRRLSPSFLRMTFTGPDLDEFGTEGLDQRIKLVLPNACGDQVDVASFTGADWYAAWRELPDDQRNPLRTYTVRAVRPLEREVDVDVVLHGVDPGAVTTRGCGLAQLIGCACKAQVGPAVKWCAAARPGDSLVLIGPNALHEGPSAGIEFRPPADATCILLGGDETAAPAICSILERLPAGTRAHAYVEVPTEHDELDVHLPEGVELRWLPRRTSEGVAPHGSLMTEAVQTTAARLARARHAGVEPEDVDVDNGILWDTTRATSAPDGVYTWIAGEAAVVKGIRRYLVRDLGIDRRAVAFMGYWREGRAES
ncbi:siderophore-interacting protein [Actinotalea sp. C106]|uniref:siderophore-interacting protein n=1 Tax=Actinotalea sp. C106 TaxID=2908644 RepID=UPI00202792AB|nr:siderophore-interacting protein [Actinotalea sp. C106]